MTDFLYSRNIKLPKDLEGNHTCIFFSCKCGCSTLKNFSIMNFYQKEQTQSGKNIWAFFDNPDSKDYVFDIYSKEEIESEEFQKAYKILVYRNPVDRLISFYKNKVCDNQYNEYYDENRNICYFRDCSFKEMVDRLYELVCEKGMDINKIGNVHLISQMYGIEDFKIDLVLKMEEMAKLKGIFDKKYGREMRHSWVVGKSGVLEKWDNTIRYFNKKCEFFKMCNNKFLFPDHSYFVNEEILHKIKEIYKNDYEKIKI